MNDITITVTYTYTDQTGQHVLQASQTCTVTPVVTAFTVTPARGTTGTNITLFNGNDGSRGLRAQPGSGVAGVAFSATLRMDNVIATAKYLQNMLTIHNGDNGTTDNYRHRKGAAWRHVGRVVGLRSRERCDGHVHNLESE